MSKGKSILSSNALKVLPTKFSELTNKLQEIHTALSELSQDALQRPLKLKEIASSIISHKLLNHHDKEVRLLSCCCIVDILRVFAPDAPFTDSETVSVFESIVSLLRGLPNHDSSGSVNPQLLYILKNLSTIKSCVVPVMLSQASVSGAHELVVSMFDTLIGSIRPSHSAEVLEHIGSIIQACVDESDEIDQELLDILLQPLLPGPKAENPMAYKLIANLFKQTLTPNLQTPLTSFFNDILVGTNHSRKLSELTEHIYSLVYEIHKVCPDTVAKVLPSICAQLQVDEETIRLKACKLLGLLFSSTYAEYCEECSKYFREYLGRLHDKSMVIRLELTDTCTAMINTKISMRRVIEDAMIHRLRDVEYEVRSKVLKAFLDIALNDPNALSVATYEELQQRFTDKRIEIRKMIMIGFAKLYQRYISSLLPMLSDIDQSEPTKPLESYIDEEHWLRLKSIPLSILKCWSYPEYPVKHLAIQLLQECVLPKLSKQVLSECTSEDLLNEKKQELESKRATALLLLFTILDENGRLQLSSMMNYKTRVRVEIEAILSLRLKVAQLKSDGQDSTIDQAMIRKRMTNLIELIPTHDKRTTVLDSLNNMRDKLIFQRLESAISANVMTVDVLSNKDDVKQRVESKSALGEYVGAIFDCSSYLVVNRNVLMFMIQHLRKLLHVQQMSISLNRGDKTRKQKKHHIDDYYLHDDHDSDIEKTIESITQTVLLLTKFASQSYLHLADELQRWLEELLPSNNHRIHSKLEINHLLSYCSVLDLAASCYHRVDVTQEDSEITMINSTQLCRCLFQISSRVDDPVCCRKVTEASCRILISLLQNSISNPYKPKIVESISEDVIAILNRLSNTSLDNMNQLECVLSSITALVSIPLPNYTSMKTPRFSVSLGILQADDYIKYRTRIMQFLTNQILCQSFISKGMNAKENDAFDDSEGSVESYRIWSVTTTALQLYSSILTAEVNINTTYPYEYSFVVDDLKSYDTLYELVQKLFMSVESNGSQLFDITDIRDKKGTVVIEEQVALILFDLLRISSVNMRLTIDQWHRLGWTLLNESNSFRKSIFEKYCVIVQTYDIPPQFLGYLSLMASDDHLKTKAETVFTTAIKRLRNAYDELCGKALAEDSDELRVIAEEHIPEIILPYVMHLLSYHPRFPTSPKIETEEDQRRIEHVIKSLKMVLRVLLDSVDKQSENISYLLKQVTTIESKYEDRHDPENIGLQFVAQITIKLLKQCIKTTDNVQIYPGEIYLPLGLYQYKYVADMESSESNVTNAVLASLTQTDQYMESNAAIDQALNRLGKGLGKPTAVKTVMKQHKSPGKGSKSLPSPSGSIREQRNNVPKSRKAVAVPDQIAEEETEDSDEEYGRRRKKPSPRKEEAIVDMNIIETRRSKRLKEGQSKEGNYADQGEDENEVLEWERVAAENEKSRAKKGPTLKKSVTTVAQTSLQTASNVKGTDNVPIDQESDNESELPSQDRLTENIATTKSKSTQSKKRPLQQIDINVAATAPEIVTKQKKETIKATKEEETVTVSQFEEMIESDEFSLKKSLKEHDNQREKKNTKKRKRVL